MGTTSSKAEVENGFKPLAETSFDNEIGLPPLNTADPFDPRSPTAQLHRTPIQDLPPRPIREREREQEVPSTPLFAPNRLYDAESSPLEPSLDISDFNRLEEALDYKTFATSTAPLNADFTELNLVQISTPSPFKLEPSTTKVVVQSRGAQNLISPKPIKFITTPQKLVQAFNEGSLDKENLTQCNTPLLIKSPSPIRTRSPLRIVNK